MPSQYWHLTPVGGWLNWEQIILNIEYVAHENRWLLAIQSAPVMGPYWNREAVPNDFGYIIYWPLGAHHWQVYIDMT